MSTPFAFLSPPERAYERRARLIVEVRDPVTLETVCRGLTLKAEGLIAKPTVSSSGRYIWLEQPRATPISVSIDPGDLPYLPQTVDVPALPPPPPAPATGKTWSFVPVELIPAVNYRFSAGITGLRGTLVQNRTDVPLRPIVDARVQLQWIDDTAAGTQWMSAPHSTFTDSTGDFAAIVRLASTQIARPDAAHRMRVRVAITHAGNTRLSPELPIPFGLVSDAQQNFSWDDLPP